EHLRELGLDPSEAVEWVAEPGERAERLLREELRARQLLAQRRHPRLEEVLEVESAHAPVEPVREHAVEEQRVRVLDRVREDVAREVEAVVAEEVAERDLGRAREPVAARGERA